MLPILLTILPIFFIILLGKIFKSSFLKNEDFWRDSEKITYYVLFPALLIKSLLNTSFYGHLHQAVMAVAFATLILSAFFILMQFIIKVERRAFTSMFQGGIRYNSYIFIGVAAALYGAEGISTVAIIIAYMIVLTNVLSVIVLDAYLSNRRSNVFLIMRNIAKNPLIIATVIGVIFNPLKDEIPNAISVFLGYLGDASLPLSLLCVGAGLKFQKAYEHWGSIFSTSVAKLILLPFVAMILLSILGVTGLPKAIAILYAAAPCAGNAYILSQQMGGDSDMMAAIISATTLLSIITIPIVLVLMH